MKEQIIAANKAANTVSGQNNRSDYRLVFDKGMQIFAEGDNRDHVYIVEQGEVELSTEVEGEKLPLVTLGPGEIFGEMALMGPGKRSASAYAAEQTELFIIPRDLIMGRLHGVDPLIGLLMSLLIDRYRDTRHQSINEALGRRDVPHFSPLDKGGHDTPFVKDWRAQKEVALKELKLAQEIQVAIERSEFVPFIQPIVTLPDEKLVGFESLIRWEHPERGLVPPFEFIPVAERTNCVQALDMLMLRHACELAPKINEAMGNPEKPVFISVNLSGVHFEKKDVVDEIRSIIKDTKVNPAFIKLEITESALVNEPMVAEKALTELKKLGVRIALDDFGTGYSSLGYLHTFSIDTIKIDRSFVQHIHSDPKSLNIVRAIVGLSKTFDLDIIAEGIESKDEIGVLNGIGCDMGQGYHFSRPMPVDDAFEFIKNR